MALTFTVTNLRGYSVGNRRARTATVTVSGTTTANGDAFAPSLIGLKSIDQMQFDGATGIDSTSSPTGGFAWRYLKSAGTVVPLSQAVAGATTTLKVITAGTSVVDILEIYATGI